MKNFIKGIGKGVKQALPWGLLVCVLFCIFIGDYHQANYFLIVLFGMRLFDRLDC